MEPTLTDGCSILIDLNRRSRLVGHIYVVRTDDGLIVKRAGKSRAGNWQLVSDNPDKGLADAALAGRRRRHRRGEVGGQDVLKERGKDHCRKHLSHPIDDRRHHHVPRGHRRCRLNHEIGTSSIRPRRRRQSHCPTRNPSRSTGRQRTRSPDMANAPARETIPTPSMRNAHLKSWDLWALTSSC